MSERISYRQEKLDHYGWLTMLGKAVWEIEEVTSINDPTLNNSRRIEVRRTVEEDEIFEEMKTFIGKPSL